MKKEIIKGYKGFDENLKCRGFQYEVGKTYETDKKIDLCDWGFHFCKNLFDVNNYYGFGNEKNRYCEIEAIGEVIDGNNKSVTNKIKIVREIQNDELKQLINTGEGNSGYCNTGNYNTGYCNTGNYNTGDCNTGYYNTGDCNTGDYNTGDCNTGDYNTGYCNTGYYNTGDYNTGYYNTGDYNTGYCNTGDYNTGYCNTGDYNKTNRSSGVFCTKEPNLIIFNKETNMTFREWQNTEAYRILNRIVKSEWICFIDMTLEEKEKYPNAETCGGYLKEFERKEASSLWWGNLSVSDKKEIISLPNFNLEIFNEIMELKISKEEYEDIKNV